MEGVQSLRGCQWGNSTRGAFCAGLSMMGEWHKPNWGLSSSTGWQDYQSTCDEACVEESCTTVITTVSEKYQEQPHCILWLNSPWQQSTPAVLQTRYAYLCAFHRWLQQHLICYIWYDAFRFRNENTSQDEHVQGG